MSAWRSFWVRPRVRSFFTSGATEANNLALRGLYEHTQTAGKRHLVVSAIEHPAVLDVARALARQGADLTILAVDKDGRVDPAKLARALRPETALVSIMLGNNETGVLQDLQAVGEVCRESGVPLHTDATQCVGKIPIDLRELPV